MEDMEDEPQGEVPMDEPPQEEGKPADGKEALQTKEKAPYSSKIYELMARQLKEDGLYTLAEDVARLVGVNLDSEGPAQSLEDLLASVETRAPAAGVGLASSLEDGFEIMRGPGSQQELPPAAPERVSKPLPNYQTTFLTTHKFPCRCSAFSRDGQYVVTGSHDASIKLLQVSKMQYFSQVRGEKGEDYKDTKPVLRTFYDHNDSINDLDFHPTEPFIVSAARDNRINFFDYSKSLKRAYRGIDETHNVRSVHFHPSGDFLIVATDHAMLRLYDVNTFKAYVTSESQKHHFGACNQVRWSSMGNIYASAGKDGSVKIWDGVTNKCINTIRSAHSGAEVSSVQFSPSTKYLLTSGKDSTVRLWELSTGKQVVSYLGSHQTTRRLNACFSFTGDFVMSGDDTEGTIVCWDTRTGELVKRLQGHSAFVKHIAASPTEAAFVSCSEDHRARFWAVVQ